MALVALPEHPISHGQLRRERYTRSVGTFETGIDPGQYHFIAIVQEQLCLNRLGRNTSYVVGGQVRTVVVDLRLPYHTIIPGALNNTSSASANNLIEESMLKD